MNINRALAAFFKGISLCFFEPRVRRLAILPWALGCVSYPLAITAAYYSHGPLLAALIDSPSGILSTILYVLAWIGIALLLAVASVLVSVVLVLIGSAAFQSMIVEEVIASIHPSERETSSGTLQLSVIFRDSLRAIGTELIKLLWLVPLIITAFVLGLIPWLVPFAFALGAWLIAYQFVDIVLDVATLSARQRFTFARRHWLAMIAFGAVVTAFFLIPLAGILLAPIATAGAAWLLAEEKSLWGARK